VKYTAGHKYQLAEDIWLVTNLFPPEDIVTEFISLQSDGIMFIKKGYAWDGPSGPTIDTDDTMTPSLFHDAAYQLIRNEHLPMEARAATDSWFGNMMRQRVSGWQPKKWIQEQRANSWVRNLRRFGASAAKSKNKRKIFYVP
jgi:hypothetical protein